MSPTTHAPCKAAWTGKGAQHCASCCQTFSGTSAGDTHRCGPFDRRRCIPAFLLPLFGLVRRADGVWSTSEYMRPAPPRRSA